MGILFDLRDVFQENNPGIKRELPVLVSTNGHFDVSDLVNSGQWQKETKYLYD